MTWELLNDDSDQPFDPRIRHHRLGGAVDDVDLVPLQFVPNVEISDVEMSRPATTGLFLIGDKLDRTFIVLIERDLLHLVHVSLCLQELHQPNCVWEVVSHSDYF